MSVYIQQLLGPISKNLRLISGLDGREKRRRQQIVYSGVRRNREESTQQSTSISSNPAQLHLIPSAIVGAKPLPSPSPSAPHKRCRLQSPLSDSGGSPATVEDTAKTNSPSNSTFFTLRKRRCLRQPLPDSGGSSATVEEFLLHQLAVNIQEGG